MGVREIPPVLALTIIIGLGGSVVPQYRSCTYVHEAGLDGMTKHLGTEMRGWGYRQQSSREQRGITTGCPVKRHDFTRLRPPGPLRRAVRTVKVKPGKRSDRWRAAVYPPFSLFRTHGVTQLACLSRQVETVRYLQSGLHPTFKTPRSRRHPMVPPPP